MCSWTIFLAALAVCLSGCAPSSFGSANGVAGMASAIESLGSTATGFRSTKSAIELNGANRDLAEAQAADLRGQIFDGAAERQRLDHERKVTADLLREMSSSYHDPILEIMARWVEAGGDPDYAFKYALGHVDSDSRTKVLPQQMLSLAPHSPPPLSSQPELPPVMKRKSVNAGVQTGVGVQPGMGVQPGVASPPDSVTAPATPQDGD